MTTLTYSTTAADCSAASGDTLDATETSLYLGGHPTSDDTDKRAWIPFVVNLPNAYPLISATIRWVANDDRSGEVLVSIYCEAADTAAAPADTTALLAKTLTTNNYDYSLDAYTTGVEYSYDITTAVQEVLNRAGWASGNTLAVIVDDNGSILFRRRHIASFEDATYAEAKLDLVFSGYVPRGGGVV